MVDTISNTRGIGRGVTRYAPSPAASADSQKPVTPVAAAAPADPDGENKDTPSGQESPGEAPGNGPRLEIAEDPVDGELIYRFIDPQSGAIMRQWDSRDLGSLREYMRRARIHLLDKKV